MSQKKKLSLQKEVKKEAVKIEQEIVDNPELKDMEVSNTMEKTLLTKIREYRKKHIKPKNSENNNHCEISEELTPNFTNRINEISDHQLSEEDQKALQLGRELLKKINDGKELHEVNKEYHKHLNEDNAKNYRGKKTKVFRFPHHKRLAVAIAALLVLVVGTGVTTIGSKSYLKALWEKVHGGQSMQIVNVKDMDTQKSEDGEEVTAFKAITDKLNIPAIRLTYKPKDMHLNQFTIDEGQSVAKLYYEYKDQIIRYVIYLNDADSSLSQKEEDNLVDKFDVKTEKQTISVEGYKVKDSSAKRWIADFEYGGVKYQLKGIMDRKEFKEILQNLAYFS